MEWLGLSYTAGVSVKWYNYLGELYGSSYDKRMN